LTVAQVGIGLLRQHIRSTDRIHGIVTDGGDAPNIVPEHAAGHWYVRSSTLAELADLYPRVERCFEAGAVATGAEVSFEEPGPAYSEFRSDAELEGIWVGHAGEVGRSMPTELEPLAGSTDMANVSLVLPTIHPLLHVETHGAVNHQPEFAAACVTQSADLAVRDGAVTLARTVVTAATNPAVRARLTSHTHRAMRNPSDTPST
ncbi:MAG: hypothetical protein WD041_04900, partial [Nitriliruptoraceae bacterium]